MIFGSNYFWQFWYPFIEFLHENLKFLHEVGVKINIKSINKVNVVQSDPKNPNGPKKKTETPEKYLCLESVNNIFISFILEIASHYAIM